MAGRGKRYQAKGQIYIAEIDNADTLLKNLSSSGLCIKKQGFMDVMPKTRYSVEITPEEESKIEKFDLEIESKWVKAKMKSSESGFVIVVPPGSSKKELLEQYLNYLKEQEDNAGLDEDEEDEETDP
jgi:D-mannonate dehydratase